MSLASWKEEFYPIVASDTTVETAIQHSLTKWIGLRQENLDRHGVHVSVDGNVFEPEEDGGPPHWFQEGSWLEIDAGTCALCYWHYDSSRESGSECDQCPLAIARGEGMLGPVPCDCWRGDETCSPYGAWSNSDRFNPKPMILWLQKALDLKKSASNAG